MVCYPYYPKSTRTMTPPISETEARIQQSCVMWYRNTYCLNHHSPRRMIFSIPNEGKPDLVRTGLLPGAADLVMIHDPHPICFVEVKTPTGRQSPAQALFQEHITSLGYRYHLIRSLIEFQELLRIEYPI
jgi:hypothetical protein